MTKSRMHNKKEVISEAIVIISVGFALFCTSFLNFAFFSESDQPYLLLATCIPYVGLLLVVIGLINIVIRLRVFPLIIASIVVCFLDLSGAAQSIGEGGNTIHLFGLYILIACVIAFLLFRYKIGTTKLIVAFSWIFLCTTVAGNFISSSLDGDEEFGVYDPVSSSTDGNSEESNTPQEVGQSNKPKYVHIVLDELTSRFAAQHTGDIATAKVLKQLADKLIDRGFLVYENAFSHFKFTEESLSNLFNFYVGSSQREYISTDSPYKMISNKWFDLLGSRSFKIDVYQTGWLDFCSHAQVNRCFSLEYNTIPTFVGLNLSTWEKGVIARRMYSNISTIQTFLKTRIYFKAYQASPRWLRNILPKFSSPLATSPLNSYAVIDQVLEGISTDDGNSDVMLIHVLIPHQPLALSKDCDVREPKQWWSSNMPWVDDLEGVFDSLYAGQVGCISEKTIEMIDKLSVSDSDVQFFIHGDHSHRRTDPSSDMGISFLHNYSTFMAFKGSRTIAGRDMAYKSLSDGFADFICTDSDIYDFTCESDEFRPRNSAKYLNYMSREDREGVLLLPDDVDSISK